jgi:hypothetical protein
MEKRSMLARMLNAGLNGLGAALCWSMKLPMSVLGFCAMAVITAGSGACRSGGDAAASEGSKRNEMKKLRIVLRYLAQPLAQRWRRRDKRPPKMYPVPAVDPEAFSNLLGSGRKEDMETLAKWLSRRRRSPA